MEKQFVILYTHQKQKKAKTWHDGVLRHNGTGTKAVLYDEKGCRLDSIHMKVDDIKLGEQLESDRYYILVEEVKTSDNSKQQDDVVSGQTRGAQIIAPPTVSRARCPGLKRKKTGFMPPRLVKQACLENSPGTQSDNEMYTGIPNTSASTTSILHNDSTIRVPLLPHQTHFINNTQDTGINSDRETLLQKSCTDNISRNLYNLYSSYNKLDNVSGSNDSSQDLTSSVENKKLSSPWSVYGSKNNSPSLGTSRFETVGRVKESDHNRYSSNHKGSNNVFDRAVENKIPVSHLANSTENGQNDLSHDRNCKSYEPLYKNISHTTEELVKQEEDFSDMKNQRSDQSKRNISQIMNLLKKKPLPEDSVLVGSTCSIKKDDLANSADRNDEQLFNNNAVGETSKLVTTSSEKSSSTFVNSISARELKDHPQKMESTSDFINGSITDIDMLQFSDEMFPGSDTAVHTNEAVSNNLKFSKDIPDQKLKEQTPTAEEDGSKMKDNKGSDKDNEGFDDVNEGLDDEELLGSFHINFSPLSHVTNTDDENEVCDSTCKENNVFSIDNDSGKDKNSVVCNVDDNDCRTQNSGILELQKETILCDDSNNDDQIEIDKKSALVNEASTKVNKGKNNSIEHIQEDNCGKKSENGTDVLNDIDREFNNYSFLDNDKEKNNVSCEIENDKREATSSNKCDDRNTHVYDSFDISGEESTFEPTYNDFEKSISNDNDVNENVDKDVLKPKISEHGKLVNNEVVSTFGDQQSLDNMNKECNIEDVGDDKCDYVDSRTNTAIAEVADQNVVNIGSQYSRTTTNSLDTLDFSCDTLDSNSPNYHGIQTQHLGRLVPRSDFNNGSVVDNDTQNVDNSHNKLANTTNIENMHSLDNDRLLSRRLYEHETSSPNTSVRGVQNNEAIPADNFSYASKCQNSTTQFHWMKNVQSNRENMSLNTVKLTAAVRHTGIEHLESEDPLGNTHDIQIPPHPSKLIHRNIRRKGDVSITYKTSPEFNHPGHNTHLIDSKLGSHGTQSISSAVVSRVHPNHSIDRTTYSSQHDEVVHSTEDSPSFKEFDIHRSSFHQLSDSEFSIHSSPAFYIDWQNNQPQICKLEKRYKAEHSPIDASSQNGLGKSSPMNTDEEEIYCKLYKPRMMYQHEDGNTKCDNSNTVTLNEDSSPAIPPDNHNVSHYNKFTIEQLSDSRSSSLECLQYQDLETFQEGKHLNKSPNSSTKDTVLFHSQFSDSSEGNFFQGHRKLPASLRYTKQESESEMVEDLGTCNQIPDSSNAVSSKWQNFVTSQTSDDCDIDMNNLTKTIETSTKVKKDFVTLKSSPGLYNTQKVFFQSNVADKDQNSGLQPMISGLQSQLSDIDDDNGFKNETENYSEENEKLKETKYQHIPDSLNNGNRCQRYDTGQDHGSQAVQNVAEDSAQIKVDKLSAVKVDKETQEEFDSEMFSSMDSFASDEFYMEDFKTSAKTKNLDSEIKEQEVPEINILNSDNGNVSNKQQQVCDSSNAKKNEEFDNGSKVDVEVKGEELEPGSDLSRGNGSKGEVDVAYSISFDFSNNEITAELDCVDEKYEDEKEDLGENDAFPEASVQVIKHFKATENVPLEKEEPFAKSSSPLTFTKSHDLIECNKNKDANVTENITEKGTSSIFSGFSLDESLDLSFSLESGTPTQPEKQVSKTASMRIGWKPPVKPDSQKSKNQSRNQTEPVLQPNSSKTLEKLRPTFKCLRLISQTKSSNEPELRTDIDKKTLSKDTELKCKLKDSSPSPKQLCDITQQVASIENDHANERISKDDKTNKTSFEQKRIQAVNLRNNMQNKSFKPPSMSRTPVLNSTKTSPCLPVSVQLGLGVHVCQTELRFLARLETERLQSVLRQVAIPDTFPSTAVYKQVLTSALTEYVNTQLLDVAKKYHQALSKVDTTGYSEYKAKNNAGVSNPNPQCQCGVPSKMISVKKEGPNCGRYFYACSANRSQQCKFFQWADETRKGGGMSGNKRKIQDSQSLRIYMSDQHVHFYGECQLIKRTKENINRYFKAPKWARNRGDGDTVQKKQIFLKLPYKGRSSLYAKDDIWVISKHLDFDPSQSFLARSTYYGPSSSLEVEIEPLALYSPNWQHEVVCHAILVGNLSSELSCMDNIRDHIQSQTPPVLPHLLNRQTVDAEPIRNSSRGFQAPRIVGDQTDRSSRYLHIHSEQMDDLCRQYLDRYNLNRDQSEAMRRIANMFSVEKSAIVDSVLLIHGVFGAGKSYLLSVMVLFLVEVFHLNDSLTDGQPFPWKLLISSTTNVAVDRILKGLLDLGFEDFVRVGSVKKIAKPVLPFSVHASGTDSQELKDLQEMLRSGELTATEKSQVRQSIEKHRLGENKKKLGRVRIVGATCASCSLTCLNNMEFPLVLLDECSQMTEPASLLPIARFACQKLVLVGDPKQLDPTIQGVDAAHQNGLEQTMFDRLIKMGNVPTLLRTQYRCHPNISAVANKLFYGGMLEDGISQTQRKPLLEILPTVCYYDVDRGVECCEAAGSYFNEREAQFVVFLLQVLLSSGIEPSAVGVITLYKSQMARISDLLTGQGDCTEMKGVQVSTVDAFQGGERDVIILSTVRSHACGFIDNDKRTNVALTRARHHLLIVGNLNNLSKNLLWGKVINHCKDFDNGIQSADEARHNLEMYLDNLKCSETSQNSLSSKSNTQNSSVKEKIPRRKKPRRKRKLSDDHVNNEPTSSLTNEQSPCSSNTSSKPCNNELSTETTGYSQPRKHQRKRQKHEDKLKNLQFDSSQENKHDDDDDELPIFSCD